MRRGAPCAVVGVAQHQGYTPQIFSHPLPRASIQLVGHGRRLRASGAHEIRRFGCRWRRRSPPNAIVFIVLSTTFQMNLRPILRLEVAAATDLGADWRQFGRRNMPAESTEIAVRSPFARSSISNGKRSLPGIDGRGIWSRRRRDLITAFTAELNRTLRERDKALIANAASLIVRCEQLHVQIVNGAEVDDDQLIRLSNVATRLLTALGLDRAKPQASGPTLADILREVMTKVRRRGVPYSSATSGTKARVEISKVLRHLGCESLASWTTTTRMRFCWLSRIVVATFSCAYRQKDGRRCFSRSGHGATSIAARNRSTSRPRLGKATLRSIPFFATGLRDRSPRLSAASSASKLRSCRTCSPLTAVRCLSEFNELLPKPDEPKVVSLPVHGSGQP